jgi:hypothetical protein
MPPTLLVTTAHNNQASGTSQSVCDLSAIVHRCPYSSFELEKKAHGVFALRVVVGRADAG